ncbi:hypothetical protein VNO78_24714 [Psophocarpus tetragonolobus]|uniref:Pentatricopeptide repeat-containing protein n=1 Tax=Psophocarpus tetragonolobus TaxID=3891 RepID=A0AAN9XF90_PSOTE
MAASSFLQNPTFLKPQSCQPTSTGWGWGWVRVRCGGPRSQRGPLVKGRILSIEAIQAIQTLKRVQRSKHRNMSSLVSKTLSRLIKSDLLATLRELLRQRQCSIALRVFSTLRSEYGADLSLYAEMAQALTATDGDMSEQLEGLILELQHGNQIQWDDHKGLASLIKALVAARSKQSTLMIYAFMNDNGYGSVIHPDHYVVHVLVNALNCFGEHHLADQLHHQYKITLPNFSTHQPIISSDLN